MVQDTQTKEFQLRFKTKMILESISDEKALLCARISNNASLHGCFIKDAYLTKRTLSILSYLTLNELEAAPRSYSTH